MAEVEGTYTYKALLVFFLYRNDLFYFDSLRSITFPFDFVFPETVLIPILLIMNSRFYCKLLFDKFTDYPNKRRITLT